jgi:hypothetical protein
MLSHELFHGFRCFVEDESTQEDAALKIKYALLEKLSALNLGVLVEKVLNLKPHLHDSLCKNEVNWVCCEYC